MLSTSKKKAIQTLRICKSLQEENAKLKQKIAENESIKTRFDQLDAKIGGAIAKIADLENNSIKPALSYAEKVKVKSNVVPQAAIRPPRNLITVYPAKNSAIKDSEETKKAIVNSMAPAQEKLKIRNVRNVNNKGVLIETETPEDLQNLMKNSKLATAGLKNLEKLPSSKFAENFKLAFKTGDKDRSRVNWVVEVSPDIRDTLKKSGRVFIDWYACHTQDFLTVSRCYKCQAFGHISKYCTAREDTCGHCTQPGHSYKDCKVKSQNPSCANSKRANKPHNHCSRDKKCPAYENALKMYINKIDYGQ
ncbi:Uncharacterized 50 kDa protein in type I retrotransposable element R1DM [Anthophora plagiata]